MQERWSLSSSFFGWLHPAGNQRFRPIDACDRQQERKELGKNPSTQIKDLAPSGRREVGRRSLRPLADLPPDRSHWRVRFAVLSDHGRLAAEPNPRRGYLLA
jgi:hypothetical protein